MKNVWIQPEKYTIIYLNTYVKYISVNSIVD